MFLGAWLPAKLATMLPKRYLLYAARVAIGHGTLRAATTLSARAGAGSLPIEADDASLRAA